MSPKQMKRRQEFKREVKNSSKITRHKCAVCGRTEETNPELEFRFCSKCDGNYEYCQEHLFTHVHVKHNSLRRKKRWKKIRRFYLQKHWRR